MLNKANNSTSPFQKDFWPQLIFILSLACWGLSLFFSYTASLQALTVLGFAIAVIGLRKPIGILGIGILCTIDAVSRVYVLTGGLFRWNTFNYWLLLVVLLHIPFLLRLNDWQTRFLQLFILLMGAQLAISSNILVGLQDMLGVISIFGILCYFAYVPIDSGELMRWLGLICGTTAAVGGLLYFIVISSNDLPAMNQNAWAFFPLAGMIAVHFAFRYNRTPRDTTIFWILLVINLAWIFLSNSRSGLLMGFCIMGVSFFNMPRRIEGRFGVIVSTTFILLVIATLFSDLQEEAIQRLEWTFDNNISVVSRTSGRSTLLEGGWYIFQNNPLGVGTGNFRSEWAALGNLDGRLRSSQVGREFAAHSGWMKALVENGFLGFILLALYTISFTITASQDFRRDILYGLCATLMLGIAWMATEFQGKALWLLAAGTMAILMKGKLQYHLEAARNRSSMSVVPPRQEVKS